MMYRFLADSVLVLHFCYVLFAVFGGLLALRWRRIWKIHLPALIWGFFVQYFAWNCPLTNLENFFRALGETEGYEAGFIEYFVSLIIYPGIITPQTHVFLAFMLVAFNVFIYFLVLRRRADLS